MTKFTDEEKRLIARAFETMFNRSVDKLEELNPMFKEIFTKCGIIGGQRKELPLEDSWIPCSERLPEDYQDVLVWFEYFRYGSYNRMYSTYGIGNYHKEYDWMVNHETGWEKLRVIAWMPLPEPWKDGEKDRD